FFHFVFVEIEFRVAFGTFRHGRTLLPGDSSTAKGIIYRRCQAFSKGEKSRKVAGREYPERPIVGVGGVVIENDRALLIRRGSAPLLGEWSIPGGMLEVGETISEGVQRELLEETALEVKVLDLIEVFERVTRDADGRSKYHFVILDYLCEVVR